MRIFYGSIPSLVRIKHLHSIVLIICGLIPYIRHGFEQAVFNMNRGKGLYANLITCVTSKLNVCIYIYIYIYVQIVGEIILAALSYFPNLNIAEKAQDSRSNPNLRIRTLVRFPCGTARFVRTVPSKLAKSSHPLQQPERGPSFGLHHHSENVCQKLLSVVTFEKALGGKMRAVSVIDVFEHADISGALQKCGVLHG